MYFLFIYTYTYKDAVIKINYLLDLSISEYINLNLINYMISKAKEPQDKNIKRDTK